jgi:hypothetical protein
MTEFYDFWNALWHDAWAPWDGLWLFQTTQRPIDRAMTSVPAMGVTWSAPIEVSGLGHVAT